MFELVCPKCQVNLSHTTQEETFQLVSYNPTVPVEEHLERVQCSCGFTFYTLFSSIE